MVKYDITKNWRSIRSPRLLVLMLMKRMMKSELYNDVWPFPSVNAGHRVFFKTKKKEEKKTPTLA